MKKCCHPIHMTTFVTLIIPIFNKLTTSFGDVIEYFESLYSVIIPSNIFYLNGNNQNRFINVIYVILKRKKMNFKIYQNWWYYIFSKYTVVIFTIRIFYDSLFKNEIHNFVDKVHIVDIFKLHAHMLSTQFRIYVTSDILT